MPLRGVTPKSYWRGTHRSVAPSETLAKFAPHGRKLGITRLADITGLDYLGIPVFAAMRPNARCLSVSQGKGMAVDAARTSAFMEAAELDHAERISRPVRTSSYNALRAHHRVASPASLPRLRGGDFRGDREIPWIKGRDLCSDEPVFVPFELVSTDFRCPARRGHGFFAASSNGLASGNSMTEALCSGLCEVIERDATSLWELRSDSHRASCRLNLRSVSGSDCKALLRSLAQSQIDVAVWDVTTDIGVACFTCRIRESADNDRSRLGYFEGSGCHPSRDIALARAVTEAAQSRLTFIAGSRDDIAWSSYHPPDEPALFEIARELWEASVIGRRMKDIPHACHDTFEEDLDYLADRLRVAGIDEIVVVDLTRAELAMPVIRVVVPGLEGSIAYKSQLPGRRARALRTP